MVGGREGAEQGSRGNGCGTEFDLFDRKLFHPAQRNSLAQGIGGQSERAPFWAAGNRPWQMYGSKVVATAKKIGSPRARQFMLLKP